MIMNASQKRSIQASVAHAILVKGLPGHRIQSLKRDSVFTLGGASVDQARTDFKVMEAGMSLCIPPITRCRFDEQILPEAVLPILSKDDVTPISWGTKQIKLCDAETVTLPYLTRRNSGTSMKITWHCALKGAQILLLVTRVYQFHGESFMRY